MTTTMQNSTSWTPLATLLAAAAVLTGLLAGPATAQTQGDPRPAPQPQQPAGGAGPQSPAREQMWYPPTEEDWQKPVQIEFERTWEDAVAVARETNKPILICINMDGEIASEHYAGVRYRDPEIAKLYDDYVCVIASVYRHTERDHDENGERIPCPRFGCVTCGEHIAIEPMLFEKYMDGRRISPRHIMVELDGSEQYDVFYAFDTDSVFQKIEEGITQRGLEPRTIVRGDRPILERVASRAREDREAVENAYAQGDKALREQILKAASDHPEAAPVELLRMAVNGFDPELAAIARQALAKIEEVQATDVIEDALRTPMPEDDRKSLVAALEKLGEQSARARTLAVVHGSSGKGSVNAAAWTGGASYTAAPDRSAVEARLQAVESEVSSESAEAATLVELAEARLGLVLNPDTSSSLATDPRTGAKYRQLMLMDAEQTARDAQARRDEIPEDLRWRLDAVRTLCAWNLGRQPEAWQLAKETAPAIPVEGLDQLDALGGQLGWNAVATLAVFADARHRDIVSAVRARRDWPGEWLNDVTSAYSVLARHPLGTDTQVASHFDLLWFLGARRRAGQALDQGLERWPSSATLHDCLRSRLLREQGVRGLIEHYDRMLEAADAPADLPWFAGYAAIVSAEFSRRRGQGEEADQAYDRALELFDRATAAKPEAKDNNDHFAHLALAGQAKIAAQNQDWDRALAKLYAAFERRPASAGELDGLSFSAVDTARLLLSSLRQADRRADYDKLREAINALPEVAFEPPEFEQDPDKAPSPDVPESGRRRRN